MEGRRMTPEAQRIAIAEACGWVEIKSEVDWLPNLITGLFTKPHLTKPGKVKVWITRREIPDYLNDLNAMRAALKSQTQAFRAEFDRLLHALAEKKQLLVTELEAKDWADCFISCLQSQRDSGN
jgi:hypothetical protein